MWCAYLFTILALVSAPSAFTSGNLLIIVAWIAQTFLQLVLLPIIIVGQNVQAAAADARAEATYKDAAAVLEEAKQIQAHLAAQDDEIEKIVAALQRGQSRRDESGAPSLSRRPRPRPRVCACPGSCSRAVSARRAAAPALWRTERRWQP